jgi:K+-sensing histidine kinase KdpD
MQAHRRVVWAVAPAALALVTWAGRAAGANPTTIGFLYLVTVLGLATWGGWAVGAASSVLAMLCFNFFFLPPYHTFVIADPSNWVALLCFLTASTLASRLVATARRRAEEAQRRQQEVLALATERERLLAQSAHLEAVRESEALKTSLLRAVSHDLRTPLTAMRLEIESLERALAGAPQALPSLRNLAVEQARLARRIDNLLAAARLETGLARPHPEPTPVGTLFRSARESLAPILAGREVTVRVTPGCPEVWADPSLALEILVNLLENAARAAPAGQPIELAATRDPHDTEKLLLEVLDRGHGVPEPVRQLLGGAGEREAAAGGLGLRIARSFAEAGGGSLDLMDRPGGGTIARLTLPAAPEPALAEEPR